MNVEQALARRPLGSTKLEVTGICVGTSPLSGMAGLYGYDVDERRAIDTILAVLDSPIRFIDTSNGYGAGGAAERRIGAAIRERGGLPGGVILATKVDPDPVTGDFSGERVLASYAESLERLGVERVPLLYLHDPERMSFEEGTSDDGALAALVRLRESGAVDYIGVAGGPVGLLGRYLDTGMLDVLLSHNRYTLLDRSAQPLFEKARAAGVGVVNAAPYGGGMLAKGPDVQQSYAYGQGDDTVVASAAAMQSLCEQYGVPLAAAALQFSLRAPFIDSTVVGLSSPERIQQTLHYAGLHVPEELWAQFDSLTVPHEFWLR